MTDRISPRNGARALLALCSAALISAAPAYADPVVEPVTASSLLVDAQEIEAAIAAPEQELGDRVGDGMASYYGRELAGNRTASGERFDPHGMTAAHRSLPLGSRLRVTNLGNGRSAVVRINDRGPFKKARIIDVSLGAAQQIQMVRSGTAMVRLELLR